MRPPPRAHGDGIPGETSPPSRPHRPRAREQRPVPALPRVPVDDGSLQEPPGDAAQLPEEHRYGRHTLGTPPGGGSVPPAAPSAPCRAARRLLLALFGVEPRLIPTTHPGEPIFCAHPPLSPPPKLDARGLQPHNVLEGQFLW